MTGRGAQAVATVVLAAMVAALAAVAVGYATAPRLALGPMLQDVTEDGFTVVWWARPAGSLTLEVGPVGHAARVVEAQRTHANGRCIAVVRGCERGDNLRYRVVHRSWLVGRRVLARGTGRLAQHPDEPIRFVAFGDSGTGGVEQYEIARTVRAHDPDLVIHTGDLVYPDGLWADYPKKFFHPYREILPTIPFYPAIGNHDMHTDEAGPFLACFASPDNGPPGEPRNAHYWFDYGPARFVALNSCLERHAPERLREMVAPWLEAAFAETDRPWKFVFFHHPPYTHAAHPPNRVIEETLVPAFEAAGVDVVFCGHNHLYERTRAIRDGHVAPDGNGVYYITTGAGGARLYAEREDPPDYIAAFYYDHHSFTLVDLTPADLRLKELDALGNVLDEWTLTKRTTPAIGARVPEPRPDADHPPVRSRSNAGSTSRDRIAAGSAPTIVAANVTELR
jgi:3',5'-cyclic AMP phosphodiesterase CpdA